MVSRTQKIRLGIFLTVAVLILLIGIGIVTGNKLLSLKTTYFIRYKDAVLTGSINISADVKRTDVTCNVCTYHGSHEFEQFFQINRNVYVSELFLIIMNGAATFKVNLSKGINIF